MHEASRFVCRLSLSMLSWSLGSCRECFYSLVNGCVRCGSGGQPPQNRYVFGSRFSWLVHYSACRITTIFHTIVIFEMLKRIRITESYSMFFNMEMMNGILNLNSIYELFLVRKLLIIFIGEK